MIFGKRKRERIKKTIIDNLTLCRLEGDLLAVEASIRDYAPKAASEEANPIKRFINGIINDISNTARSYMSKELAVDRERAQKALKDFRDAHDPKDLELSKDTAAFKKYIDKQLFKNDKDGRGRLAFALMFAIDGKGHEYQCPADSLEVVSEILFDDPKRIAKLYSQYEKNFLKINNNVGEFERGFGLGTGIGGALALSILPATVTGAYSILSYIWNKHTAKQTLKDISPSEAYTTLAFSLTLLEASKGERDVRDMADELLEKISNIRADAEYTIAIERVNVSTCREKIRTCELAFERLTQIMGA